MSDIAAVDSESKTRILIVDDHFVVRNGLIAALETEPDLAVVASADSAKAAFEVYDRCRPHIVILDLHLTDMAGAPLVRAFVERSAAVRVLVYSAYARDEELRGALEAGAFGYVQKSADRDELIMAVRTVARGVRYVSAALQRRVRELRCGPTITQRERDVLAQVVRGKSNKEIATTLDISADTVKQHISTLMRKLDVHDRAEAAIEAVKRGIIHIAD